MVIPLEALKSWRGGKKLDHGRLDRCLVRVALEAGADLGARHAVTLDTPGVSVRLCHAPAARPLSFRAVTGGHARRGGGPTDVHVAQIDSNPSVA